MRDKELIAVCVLGGAVLLALIGIAFATSRPSSTCKSERVRCSTSYTPIFIRDHFVLIPQTHCECLPDPLEVGIPQPPPFARPRSPIEHIYGQDGTRL